MEYYILFHLVRDSRLEEWDRRMETSASRLICEGAWTKKKCGESIRNALAAATFEFLSVGGDPSSL